MLTIRSLNIFSTRQEMIKPYIEKTIHIVTEVSFSENPVQNCTCCSSCLTKLLESESTSVNEVDVVSDV